MNQTRAARAALGAAMPLLLVGTGLLPWVFAWSDLPDPVATHWNIHGDANGSMTKAFAVGFFAVLLAGFVIWLVRAVHDSARNVRPSIGIGASVFGASTIALVSLVTVVANSSADTWRDVELTGAAVPVVLAAAVVIAIGAVGVANGLPTAVEQRVSARPIAPPSSDERVAWVGAAHGRGNRLIAVAGAIATVALLAVGIGSVAVGIFLTTIAFAELVRVHVVISRAGIRVRPPLGWPTVRIPIERIAGASAIDVRPMDWGGWGYRGSLRLANRAAWVVRKGPGLKLDLVDGGLFVVTVDDADEALAVLNSLRAPLTH